MPKRSGGKGGVYLYAVIPGSEERNFEVKGINDSEVYTLPQGDLCAVVSDMPSTDKLRPERRHLAAHQRVLTHLVENYPVVLPVSFGTVPDNAKAVQDVLSRYQDEMLKQIVRVEGKVEMELRVALDVPNVFEYFVSKDSELRKFRDEIFDNKHEPSREEKIDLGQKFESVLNRDRESTVKKVEKVLGEYCREIKHNRVRNEQEMMRISCLIEKDKKDVFTDGVSKAAEQFDDNYVFDYNGPVPPYNFVDVHIRA